MMSAQRPDHAARVAPAPQLGAHEVKRVQPYATFKLVARQRRQCEGLQPAVLRGALSERRYEGEAGRHLERPQGWSGWSNIGSNGQPVLSAVTYRLG